MVHILFDKIQSFCLIGISTLVKLLDLSVDGILKFWKKIGENIISGKFIGLPICPPDF